MGKVANGLFDRLGVHTIEQLRRLSLELARIDGRILVPDREAKSISHETTFATDISDVEVLRAWLLDLSDHVGRRLRRHQQQGRTVHIKVRFANFHTITRSRTLTRPTDVTHDICQAARELLSDALRASHLGVRLLGIGVTGSCGNRPDQQTPFEDESDAKHAKQRQLERAAARSERRSERRG